MSTKEAVKAQIAKLKQRVKEIDKILEELNECKAKRLARLKLLEYRLRDSDYSLSSDTEDSLETSELLESSIGSSDVPTGNNTAEESDSYSSNDSSAGWQQAGGGDRIAASGSRDYRQRDYDLSTSCSFSS